MVEEKTIIEQANEAAARLEAATKANEEILKKIEAIESRKILGGESTAGKSQAPEISEEEKMKIGLKNYWRGSAIEGYF